MLKYDLTIAIPVYNKEKYIKKCIESAINQNYNKIEILVVDNCSTDNSWNIINSFGDKIRKIKNDRNLGMAGNWNKCIDLCNTELIMILHADDELIDDIIIDYINFFKENNNVGFIHADGIIIDNGNNYEFRKNETKILTKGKQALDRVLGCPDIICSSVILNSFVFKKLGYFINDSLSSDLEMRGRIAKDFNIGYLNKCTVKILKSDNSTGYKSILDRNIKEIINDWENLANSIISYYDKKDLKNVVYLKNKLMISWILGIIKVAIKNKQKIKLIKSFYYIIFRYNGFYTVGKFLYLKYYK